LGYWAPTPKPQSPIPNPQSPLNILIFFHLKNLNKINNLIIKNKKNKIKK